MFVVPSTFNNETKCLVDNATKLNQTSSLAFPTQVVGAGNEAVAPIIFPAATKLQTEEGFTVTGIALGHSLLVAGGGGVLTQTLNIAD